MTHAERVLIEMVLFIPGRVCRDSGSISNIVIVEIIFLIQVLGGGTHVKILNNLIIAEIFTKISFQQNVKVFDYLVIRCEQLMSLKLQVLLATVK